MELIPEKPHTSWNHGHKNKFLFSFGLFVAFFKSRSQIPPPSPPSSPQQKLMELVSTHPHTYFKHIGTEKETETENSIYSKWKNKQTPIHKLNHPFLSFPFHIFLLSKNNNNNRPNFWSNNNHTLLVMTANYYSLEFARLLFISYSPPPAYCKYYAPYRKNNRHIINTSFNI